MSWARTSARLGIPISLAVLYMAVAGELSFRYLWDTLLMRLLPGFLGGGKRKVTGFYPSPREEDLKAILEYIRQGKVRAVIDSRYPLDQVPDAFRKLKTHRARGKIIIDINPEPDSGREPESGS